MNKKISILGCGWLGFPLAKHLVNLGYDIKGSTTQANKLSLFKESEIDGHVIQLNDVKVEGKLDEFFTESETLVINIPPNRSAFSESYNSRLSRIVPFIEASQIKNIIFVSSTTVYDNQDCIITEENQMMSNTVAAKELLASENLFKNIPNVKTIILRFGGLINEFRQPIKFLVNKPLNTNPDHAVNLIHLDDCIRLIKKIIDKIDDIPNHQILIGVNQKGFKRRKYYNKKAEILGLQAPVFSDFNEPLDKKIDNPLTREILNYTCVHDI